MRTFPAIAVAAAAIAFHAAADTEYHNLASGAFSQDWSDTNRIVVANTWSGVRSIVGYRGDGLTTSAGTDPRTIVAEGTQTVNVIVNQANPGALSAGGIGEFDGLSDPVVALQGSGTARAPFLLLHMCSTGMMQVRVQYDLRDVDGSADNAIQQVALQYRTGPTGDFVNVPAGYVADATTGPLLATQVTCIDAVLPTDADDRDELQIRIITSDAAGSDEWVGVDNISVSASPLTVVERPVQRDDRTCAITCGTRAGWNYVLQRSTNLTDWDDARTAFEGDGTVHEFLDDALEPSQFWRIKAWPR